MIAVKELKNKKMPTLILKGGDKVNVNQDESKNLVLQRWGKGNVERSKVIKPFPKETPILIKHYGIFQLGDIMKVKNVTEDATERNENVELKAAIIEKNRRKNKEMQSWNPLDKAAKTLRTHAYLVMRARGNNLQITEMLEDPWYSKLAPKIVKFFEKNPKEVHCPVTVYQNLIPNNATGPLFNSKQNWRCE